MKGIYYIILTLIFISMLLAGCGKTKNVTGWTASIFQSASSTKIGCLPEEITISDLDNHGISRQRDWVATCNGKSYFCSGVNDGHGGTTDVSCIKMKAKTGKSKKKSQ